MTNHKEEDVFGGMEREFDEKHCFTQTGVKCNPKAIKQFIREQIKKYIEEYDNSIFKTDKLNELVDMIYSKDWIDILYDNRKQALKRYGIQND